VADTPFERIGQLVLGLVVAVHVDPLRVEAARQRQVELPA
jgi:hypothetical protein